MKPPPFAYHAPTTVEETLGLLDGDGTSASWPAGRASSSS